LGDNSGRQIVPAGRRDHVCALSLAVRRFEKLYGKVDAKPRSALSGALQPVAEFLRHSYPRQLVVQVFGVPK